MKILLLGKHGQVGWELQRSLAPLGELIALDRHGANGLCGDLGDLPGIAATVRAVQPQVIVNAAAYTAVDKAESERDLAQRLNAEAPAVLAREAAACGALLLHYSTDYVFDGTKPAPYVEDDPVAPIGAYGRSKLKGEANVLAAHPGAIVLRTAWVYHHTGGNFVKTMLRLGETRDTVNVVADQIGCPTYAADIADALLAVAARPDRPGVFHLAGSEETNWHGLAAAIFAETARRGLKTPVLNAITTAEYPTPAKRPANSRLDGSKLKAAYGVTMPGWRTALPRCLEKLL